MDIDVEMENVLLIPGYVISKRIVKITVMNKIAHQLGKQSDLNQQLVYAMGINAEAENVSITPGCVMSNKIVKITVMKKVVDKLPYQTK